MKIPIALLALSSCVFVSSLGAVTAEFHTVNGRPLKERIASPQPVASNESSVLQKEALTVPSQTQMAIIGWLGIERGMSESELRRQLGSPRKIEVKGDHELWRYITGAVWVKDHKVAAWMQVILN